MKTETDVILLLAIMLAIRAARGGVAAPKREAHREAPKYFGLCHSGCCDTRGIHGQLSRRCSIFCISRLLGRYCCVRCSAIQLGSVFGLANICSEGVQYELVPIPGSWILNDECVRVVETVKDHRSKHHRFSNVVPRGGNPAAYSDRTSPSHVSVAAWTSQQHPPP